MFTKKIHNGDIAEIMIGGMSGGLIAWAVFFTLGWWNVFMEIHLNKFSGIGDNSFFAAILNTFIPPLFLILFYHGVRFMHLLSDLHLRSVEKPKTQNNEKPSINSLKGNLLESEYRLQSIERLLKKLPPDQLETICGNSNKTYSEILIQMQSEHSEIQKKHLMFTAKNNFLQ